MDTNSQADKPGNRTHSDSSNRFDMMEWAGAFGDLSTLIPFVAGYVGILKMDPTGILFAFGAVMVIFGVYYKTPIPVQPMKAIGAIAITQAAHAAVITPITVVSASLATGAIWLLVGVTGAANWIDSLVPRSVATGIVLGLGISFMIQGAEMMVHQWVIATIGFLGTLPIVTSRRYPAMFLLLLFGGIYSIFINPELVHQLISHSIEIHAPVFVLQDISWSNFLTGFVFLSIPQLPLTLGNAVVAIRDENNRLFPQRPVTDKVLTISTGLMNIFGSIVGGVPMCHGAGGMAGHVVFGARTGGSIIILGTILLSLSLFFSGSIDLLLHLFPAGILGVMLFFSGAQLASGSFKCNRYKSDHIIIFMTAAFSLWNIGLAFIIGIVGAHLVKRGKLKL